jgi:hypothetical protein
MKLVVSRLSKAAGLTFIAVSLTFPTGQALAWGDEGHEVVALIAVHYLRPDVLAKVEAILANDTGNDLTAHDIAAEATWADKFRGANIDGAKAGTGQWHFIDIELAAPDQASACFGRPMLAAGQAAYPGIARDCVVDKIDEFSRSLPRLQHRPPNGSWRSNLCCILSAICISRFARPTIMIVAATISC